MRHPRFCRGDPKWERKQKGTLIKVVAIQTAISLNANSNSPLHIMTQHTTHMPLLSFLEVFERWAEGRG
jgi:hypothetical protein